jgi:hypothetical protein
MSKAKIILLHPLIVTIVGVLGVMLCLALGLKLHTRELLLAAGICLAAGELAMIPVFVVRGKPADNVAQGALIATVLHMAAAAGGGMLVLQLVHPPQAFVYWLCAFYWTTLAGVCRVLMQAVKSAPIPAMGPSTT